MANKSYVTHEEDSLFEAGNLSEAGLGELKVHNCIFGYLNQLKKVHEIEVWGLEKSNANGADEILATLK